jgi:hypothetical protein
VPTRTALALALVTGLLALPLAAGAGGLKGPVFLTVSANGQLLHFHPPGSVTTVPIGIGRPTGKYDIGFRREDLTGCAATATTADGWVGVVGVALGVPSPNFVTIFTMDSASKQLVDLPFHLILMCPK